MRYPVLVVGLFLAACSAAPDECAVGKTVPFANSQIAVEAAPEGNLIQLIRYQQGSGCQPEAVDSYEEEGGNPTLEAVFTHSVKGEPNLFTIVSWPMNHVGANLKGTVYSVYAYHERENQLVRNDLVVKNRHLYGGIVGTVEGEPMDFAGTTQAGVIGLLKQFELE